MPACEYEHGPKMADRLKGMLRFQKDYLWKQIINRLCQQLCGFAVGNKRHGTEAQLSDQEEFAGRKEESQRK